MTKSMQICHKAKWSFQRQHLTWAGVHVALGSKNNWLFDWAGFEEQQLVGRQAMIYKADWAREKWANWTSEKPCWKILTIKGGFLSKGNSCAEVTWALIAIALRWEWWWASTA